MDPSWTQVFDVKLTDASGNLVSTPHQALLVFVKENGQWKVAADAVVPMMATE
jgi:ketosteroid isomerase-like protein